MLRYRVSVASVVRSFLCVWLACASAGAATFETIYNFAGGSDGLSPQFAPAIGAGGVLYGTTLEGGNMQGCNGFGCGTAFSLTPPTSSGGAWTKTTLWVFGGPGDGSGPSALTLAAGGCSMA
jgi:hypothetical protein